MLKLEYWRITPGFPQGTQFDSIQELTDDGDWHECFVRMELNDFVHYVSVADICDYNNYHKE